MNQNTSARQDGLLPAAELRWCCAPSEVGVASTAEVEPLAGVVGQKDAIDALRYGLETDAPGQHIYVRGLSGTGRLQLVRDILEEIEPPCPVTPDRCYVHNFEEPNSPTLVSLPRGRGRAFQERIDELVQYIREELLPALSSESIEGRREVFNTELQERMRALSEPFEAELTANDMRMASVRVAGGTQAVVLPLIDGELAPPEQIQQLVSQGRLDEAAVQALRSKTAGFTSQLERLNLQMHELREEHRGQVRTLVEDEARRLLTFSVSEIEGAFPTDEVHAFLTGIVHDVVTRQLGAIGEGKDSTPIYRVNLVHGHGPDSPCPILVETQPTLKNLLGVIDRQVIPGGGAYSDHTMIQGGSLLHADGGYLLLEARDVLQEPGAWKVLVRTLRTGKLEISPTESLLFGSSAQLKPQPIPVTLKVVVIGDPGLYHALDAHDADFPQLFKVLADFDSSLPRDAEGLGYYAGVLARLVEQEQLPHFDASAIATLAEHGVRISGRRDRLTARLGRLSDLAREAAFLTRKNGAQLVTGQEVQEAIRRTKRRADLPARRFRERIADGTIRIQTSGPVVGQVNGLAVTHAGPLTYGFPARITATAGPGNRGTINIEREAQLSGAIHTKGFYILGGLLRHLMAGLHHPLAFSASIAFEQSYGGIDGDSASGAEMCCLLSALTNIPLDQGIAMTGAIDQHGHIQPIGAATEKIEGFFDACSDAGMDGQQGVIIPAANVGDLMLRQDVVEACEAQRFHVWAVGSISQALEIFTGVPAGAPDEQGLYPEGSLLALAMKRADAFWAMSRGAWPPAEREEEEEALEDDEAESGA